MCKTIALGLAATLAAIAPALAVLPDFDAARQWVPGQPRQALQAIDSQIPSAATNAALRAGLEAGLLQLLASDAHLEVRAFAAQRLEYIGSPSLVPQLRPLLLAENSVGLACLVLTAMPAGPADQVLIEALAQTPAANRVQIINTLGERRAAPAIAPLEKLARTGTEVERDAAFDALGQIGTKPASQALLGLRKQVPPALNPAWERGLLRCAQQLHAEGQIKPAAADFKSLLQGSSQTQIRRGAFAGLLSAQPETAADLIGKTLRGTDAILRPMAVQAIPQVPAKQLEPLLPAWRAALQPRESVWMIQAFAKSEHPLRGSVLQQAARAKDPAQREAAYAALGDEASAAAVRVLLDALRFNDLSTDRAALQAALAGVPVKPEMDALLAGAAKDLAPDRAALLMAALGRRGSTAHFELILRATARPEPTVARAAWLAVPKVAQPAQAAQVLQALAGATLPDAAPAAAQVVGTVEPPAARGQLVVAQFNAASTDAARAALLSLLPEAPGEAALALIKANLRPGSPVGEAAREALLEYPDPAAWDAVLALAGTETDAARKSATLRALARLAAASPAPDQVGRFQAILPLAGTADLRALLGEMSGAASPGTLQIAVGLLENAEVRAEAKAAVKRLAEALQKSHPEEAKAALARANR